MFTNAFANDLLKLIFHGQPISNLASNAAITPATQFWLSLHVSDPGANGTQETSEVSYTGYTRVYLQRDDDDWVIAANKVSPVGRVEFPEMTGGIESLAMYVGIGMSGTGAGKLLMRGKLNPTIQCRLGVVPAIKQGASITFVTTAS